MPERIAPEPLLKAITKAYAVAGHVWVDLQQNRGHEPVTYDASESHKAAEHTSAVRINSDKLTDPNS